MRIKIRKRRDISGQKFNKLTAIKFVERRGNLYYWLFRCDCGNEFVTRKTGAITGEVRSCGCLRDSSNKRRGVFAKHYKHGLSNSRFIHIWSCMKARCLSESNDSYKYYGERGIKVCDRWMTFNNFMDDMYSSYLIHVKIFGEKNTTIDRLDNNKGYFKDNCRWATWRQQRNNQRILIAGKICA